MRIVIDMQGAQSDSRFRGIGRYTLGFAKGVVKNRGRHEVLLVLNGLLKDSITEIRNEFLDLLPEENIKVWFAPGPVSADDPKNQLRADSAQIIREAFIQKLKPDVVHICSLFEGFGDDAIVSIGAFENQAFVSVSLFDIIPLVEPEHYLNSNSVYSRFYLNRVTLFKSVDLFLSISETTSETVVKELKLQKQKVVTVGTATDSKFVIDKIDPLSEKSFVLPQKLKKPFILYTGGADQRKNLRRLIEAFSILDSEIRIQYCLLFAGKLSEEEKQLLIDCAKNHGLNDSDLQFTGYISDSDLIQLYRNCSLFIFPSWNEGFGLPILEAMQCGAVVIGSNRSSIPDLIGFDEALFDPFDVNSISEKIREALLDEKFRAQSKRISAIQKTKFSWDITSKKAIESWESKVKTAEKAPSFMAGKLKLAFVTPVPPAQTGIADYASDLLSELCVTFDVFVITDQIEIEAKFRSRYNIKSSKWLKENTAKIDRVVYQMGNSPFHDHMIELCTYIPGIIVLHDFYLSGLSSWRENFADQENYWAQQLYNNHGYKALASKFHDRNQTILNYPVSFNILNSALGVIVHSEFSKELKETWYPNLEIEMEVIPHVRIPSRKREKDKVRNALRFEQSDFLVCSFGHLAPTKMNMRVLRNWFSSLLGKDPHSKLIFVGENEGGSYGKELVEFINANNLQHRVFITGYVTEEAYQEYLTICDLAVQLRCNSRGESSGSVLDCMNYGLPLILNAHGTNREINADVVELIRDEFTDYELINSLEELWRDKSRRIELGVRARNEIQVKHAPKYCAERYTRFIEEIYSKKNKQRSEVIEAIVSLENAVFSEEFILDLATSISKSFPHQTPLKRLFLDVSATSRMDHRSGIERVTRGLVSEFINNPPIGFQVEPVYLDKSERKMVYRFARNFTLNELRIKDINLNDEIVNPKNGDIVLVLDMSGNLLQEAESSGLFIDYQNLGVKIYAVLYDILPITMPNNFPSFSEENHRRYLGTLASFDGVACISKTVAYEYESWLKKESAISQNRKASFKIVNFRMGADLQNSYSSKGEPINKVEIIQNMKKRISFLMVGTIEPRKAYRDVIAAFDKLWDSGLDVNLVIVGKEGWKGLPDEERQNISQIIVRIKNHPRLNQNLFWLEDASDEFLVEIYDLSTCFLAASYGEGFGLPLIEAAQRKKPIIARDILVFREVADNFAYFFEDGRIDDIATAIQNWLELFYDNRHPKSDEMPCFTWAESAKQLGETLTA
jgi:glycosyltransferase involved in cell wall biosynthesis